MINYPEIPDEIKEFYRISRGIWGLHVFFYPPDANPPIFGGHKTQETSLNSHHYLVHCTASPTYSSTTRGIHARAETMREAVLNIIKCMKTLDEESLTMPSVHFNIELTPWYNED
jgi:hypothetical protein